MQISGWSTAKDFPRVSLGAGENCLNQSAAVRSNPAMKTTLTLVAAASLMFGNLALAGSKTYQVTGPVLETSDTMIAVQKGKDRWELARDASTKANGEVKVGDKVTVTYTMTATEIESKGAGKADKKAAASPSPAKK
ncbi:MAG: hypothetical protein ACJ8HQ_04380 [Chthoniobacterales bacterium]